MNKRTYAMFSSYFYTTGTVSKNIRVKQCKGVKRFVAQEWTLTLQVVYEGLWVDHFSSASWILSFYTEQFD